MITSHCCIGHSQVHLENGPALDAPSAIVVDWDLSDIASSLLKLVGLPPNTTTISEMDEEDARFVCLSCSTEDNDQAMTWRGAVSGSHYVVVLY